MATPPVIGMAVQPWAGSAVFRPMGKARIRLCTLPALVLEANEAVPVTPGPDVAVGNSCQPLFYVDSRVGVRNLDDLLRVLSEKFTRQRFS